MLQAHNLSQGRKHREMKSLAQVEGNHDSGLKLSENRVNSIRGKEYNSDLMYQMSDHTNSRQNLRGKKLDYLPPLNQRY